MKKLLLFVFAVFTIALQAQSQSLTNEIITKYMTFLDIQERSVLYEATIEYNSGEKAFVKIGNKISSYNVKIDELGIDLKSPDVEGLRVENGTVMIGTIVTSFTDVNTIDIHRETWFDDQQNVVQDEIFSESPLTSGTVLGIDTVDNETQEFIDAMVKFINSRQN